MASTQCHRPVDQTCCNQGQQSHSLGHKVYETATRVFKKGETHNGPTMVQTHTTHVHTQTQTHSASHGHGHSHGSHSGHGLAKSHTQCVDQTRGHHHQANGTNGTGTTCQGKTRRGGHEKGRLFQKIKDRISGHSDGSSSSSSESESDDDEKKCGKNKN